MMRRSRSTASVLALVLLLGTLVVLAYQYDGKPFTEVDLNDGGVWVTNQDQGLMARVNPQIQELDLGVDAGSGDFDVFQKATQVYVDDDSTARAVKPVDVARASVLDPTELPTGAYVAQGGDTFAVVDTVSGKAWVRTAEGLRGFAAKTSKPDLTGVLTAAVGTDGRAYVLGRDGKVTPVTTDESGRAVTGDRFALGTATSDPADVTMTVVGDTPVVYNRSTLEVSRPEAEPVEVQAADPSGVALQQPSARADEVYIATREGLFTVPLEGGDLREVSRGPVAGAPAAPVVLTATGCVYAAWADPTSPNNYLRDCAADENDDTAPIQGMSDTAELVFRVNRDVVVLNDTRYGDSWLVQDPGKAKIDNWPAVDPNNRNRSKIKETTDEPLDQENRPPEPQDDDFGARPGRTTVFPVVAFNDHDPDGDIISIAKVTQQSGEPLEVRVVGGGTQLQIAIPADAAGKAVFRYWVTDGKVNEQVPADLRVQIRTADQHAPPKLMPDRQPKLTVTRGATADYYLLADYYDPDGDDLTLTDATARGGQVEFRPDGTLTFTDDGSGIKTAEIQYTVDDGIDRITAKIAVQVVGDAAPPELVADLASGVADKQVVVQPLTNDRNPEGTDLTLKNVRVVGDDTGTTVTEDLEGGTFTFRATKARSYYLQYTAYNSAATRSSVVRLDIESPPKDNRRPVAVRDKATVTPGGTAQVDLLLNDLDPDGDVLVVKRVGEPSVPGVKVSVVDKRLAVVSTTTDLVGRPAIVEYVVSDGRSTAVGQLVVAQRGSSQANRHPVANKDQVTVRAGSVTTIPVLTNDSDPDGAKPRLFQSDLINDEDLEVWVAGDTLRLRAPDEPGSYSVIYGVRDTDGLKATAQVSIFVIADSAKNNHPPVPQPIIDRVIAGRPKVIPVDLVGADPDGDAVAFQRILTAPSLGRVLDTGVDWIRYEGFEGKAGTDFFQIIVRDKYGATGVAEVRVGVVPAEAENQPPVALDDNVLVQPDRTISYNVLTNDVDPDDDPLRIAAVNSAAQRQPEHQGGAIELQVGKAPDNGSAATNIGYTIEDSAGAQDDAVLRVTASHDAPFYAPIARDDVADLADIIGRDPGAWVDVPVLDNDLDFDGPRSDLKVTQCTSGKGGECRVEDDTSVRVKLTAKDQVVLYRLDDADDESSDTFGVIYVTGTDNVPPQLTTDEDRIPVKTVTGEPVTIDLADIVVTRAGRRPRLVLDQLPSAVNGAVEPVKEAPTSLTFTPTRRYIGPASVTVAVSDGRSAGDDGALTSLLTIPIDVQPSGNVAPVMRDAAVDVGADDDAAEVDLAGLTTDANKGDIDTMTYTVESAEAGLTTRIDEGTSILSVEADGGLKDGRQLKIVVVADDGHGGTTKGTVTAHIVDSDRPMLRIPPINVNATRDKATSVDIADYAVNPFPGEPITASSPKAEGGGQFDDLETDGSVVRFTPLSAGTSTIRLTISDASGDRARDVTARINVTVVDVPDAPTRPILSSVEASSAVLTWREPEANGAAIDEYEVVGPHGFKQRCLVTTCTLQDLTPGEAYTFTVRAHNSEGWGEAGPESEQIVPNKAPDLMTPPTIVVESKPTGTRMDRQLTVRWKPPNNEGSEITSYEIKEAGSGRTWTAAGDETSMVVPGLTNGTPYAFEIRAVNDVEPRRQFSGASQAVAPFGVPLRSGTAPQLSASEDGLYTGEPWVRIDWSRWTASQSNGNAVTGYVVTCRGCRQSTYKITSPATTFKQFDTGDGIRKGQTVTLSVAAVNDAGTSDPSPSVSGRPWTKAGPVRDLHEVGSSPSDKTARIAWDAPADDGGLDIRYYAVQTGSGTPVQVSQAPGASGQLITFPDNGTHSIKVWAVTFNGNRAIEGQSETLNGIETWGKPDPPSLRSSSISSNPYEVRLDFQAGARNGDKAVLGVQYTTDPAGGWTDGSTFTAPVPEGGTSIQVWARTVSAADGDRKYSDAVQFTGTSRAKTLDVIVGCGFGSCTIKVYGDGYIKQPQPVTTTLSTGLNPNDKCNFSQNVDGSFGSNWQAGGTGCRVSGSGTVTVSVSGMSLSKPVDP